MVFRFGLWPAALFLLAFVWLELVNPATSASLPAVRLWFALVGALTMVGAAVYGDTWFARADPFEVYSNLLAKLTAHLLGVAYRPVLREVLQLRDGRRDDLLVE